MTTVLNIAQRILDENNYPGSPPPETTEYLIKNAIDYINTMASTKISFTPSGGTASLTASDSEIATVKFATTLLIRAYHDRGPNTSAQGLALTTLIADPQFVTFTKWLNDMIQRLRPLPFVLGKDPLPNE